MGSDDATRLVDVVEADRRRLLALSYRMLGTVSEAEDAVQETYLRWYRLGEAERAAIANPQGWLTRVAGRVCLDLLGSARARREHYVGPWLPEPVPADMFLGTAPAPGRSVTAPVPPPDPLDRVILDDAVSMALLVVLEVMTAAERVTFVLHDVFAMPFPEIAEVVGRSPAAVRQLATSARRRVRDRSAPVAPTLGHDRSRAVAEELEQGVALGHEVADLGHEHDHAVGALGRVAQATGVEPDDDSRRLRPVDDAYRRTELHEVGGRQRGVTIFEKVWVHLGDLVGAFVPDAREQRDGAQALSEVVDQHDEAADAQEAEDECDEDAHLRYGLLDPS